MRGKAAWCLAAAALSFSGLRTQSRPGPSYREIVEQLRVDPDGAVERVLDLPDEVIARGVDEAARADSEWSLVARGAALLLHTDAALYLQTRDRSAAWRHVDRAQRLADALARDPESAWLAHQWFVVLDVAFKNDARVKPLVEHWHAEPWYAATAAMDRGLDLESFGSEFGSFRSTRDAELQTYNPDAFIQAKPFFNHALAAHLEIAAVHLGRIEMLEGHVSDARRLFSQAASESHWRTTTYLANLFLGSLDERDTEWTMAEQRYRTAVRSIEGAQSGRLALAALLGRHGRGAEATRIMAEGGEGPSLLAFDPWWSYLYPYGDRRFGTGLMLGEMHVAVGR